MAARTALTLSPELAFAQERSEAGAKVRIGQNECWTGPMAPGAQAADAAIAVSNRYSPNDEHGQLVRAIAKIENVPEDHIMTWPGSNEALARSVVAFCSPTKSSGPGRSDLRNLRPRRQIPQCADQECAAYGRL